MVEAHLSSHRTRRRFRALGCLTNFGIRRAITSFRFWLRMFTRRGPSLRSPAGLVAFLTLRTEIMYSRTTAKTRQTIPRVELVRNPTAHPRDVAAAAARVRVAMVATGAVRSLRVHLLLRTLANLASVHRQTVARAAAAAAVRTTWDRKMVGLQAATAEAASSLSFT